MLIKLKQLQLWTWLAQWKHRTFSASVWLGEVGTYCDWPFGVEGECLHKQIKYKVRIEKKIINIYFCLYTHVLQ